MPVEVALRAVSRGPLRVHEIDVARSFGVDAFLTDRSGGVSEAPFDSLNLALHVGDDEGHVRENRRRVCAAIGVPDQKLMTVTQVHGNEVVDVDVDQHSTMGDALVTTAPDTALAVLVADCIPMLIVDEASPRFAVVHAGWRGLASSVLASAVARFERPGSLHAFIGPSISARRYEVGPEVAAHFIHVPEALTPHNHGRSRLDIRAVAVHQFQELGLHDGHLFVSRESTDGGAPFYSDRAARPSGRFALVAKRLVA